MVLQGRQPLHPETETLLVFAARREHLDKVIRPALRKGTWILCDRFTDATFAYQSGGSRVDWEKVGLLERWVQAGLQPDLTILFDVSPEIGRRRAGRKRRPDRFERERAAYFRRVHAAYRRRARENPRRIRILDGTGSRLEVRARLEQILTRYFR